MATWLTPSRSMPASDLAPARPSGPSGHPEARARPSSRGPEPLGGVGGLPLLLDSTVGGRPGVLELVGVPPELLRRLVGTGPSHGHLVLVVPVDGMAEGAEGPLVLPTHPELVAPHPDLGPALAGPAGRRHPGHAGEGEEVVDGAL